MGASEQSLINGCAKNDRASQKKLFDRYSPKMLVVSQRYARTKEDAQEILQEAFYRIFKNIKQFRGEGSFEGWIRKIVVNIAIARYKSRSNIHPVIPISSVKNLVQEEPGAYSDLSVKEMIKIIQTLPTSYRMVFNLYVFEGFKHREIAEMLGISEGTSKSNLSDARVWLKKHLMVVRDSKLKLTK